MWWVVGVVAVVVVAATYLTWTAGRVDRLHGRAAAAYNALDAHLVRRAAAVTTLATTEAGRVDVGLERAAAAALAARPEDREHAENDLTRLLRELPPTSLDNGAFAEVTAASRRVALARSVHNDLVRDALAARRRPLVRVLRLTRRHARPAYFDIDDTALDGQQPS